MHGAFETLLEGFLALASEAYLLRAVSEDPVLVEARIPSCGIVRGPKELQERFVADHGGIELELNNLSAFAEPDLSFDHTRETPVQRVDTPVSAEPEGRGF